MPFIITLPSSWYDWNTVKEAVGPQVIVRRKPTLLHHGDRAYIVPIVLKKQPSYTTAYRANTVPIVFDFTTAYRAYIVPIVFNKTSPITPRRTERTHTCGIQWPPPYVIIMKAVWRCDGFYDVSQALSQSASNLTRFLYRLLKASWGPGSGVQSIVSLTSSLRGQLVKCDTTL